jgi:hypothetical protein
MSGGHPSAIQVSSRLLAFDAGLERSGIWKESVYTAMYAAKPCENVFDSN